MEISQFSSVEDTSISAVFLHAEARLSHRFYPRYKVEISQFSSRLFAGNTLVFLPCFLHTETRLSHGIYSRSKVEIPQISSRILAGNLIVFLPGVVSRIVGLTVPLYAKNMAEIPEDSPGFWPGIFGNQETLVQGFYQV